ncbi:hypothetical protein EVAR_32084_1 [Eumeta japonica]|uniref:Uncharacterized protein n=1 Tax=Eumeta variegata TaxID=151549 RepID=A0A4C1V5E3_EUMVA|nr:hypothetical protein EVAR_32084_1 [Eumeta japonica]
MRPVNHWRPLDPNVTDSPRTLKGFDLFPKFAHCRHLLLRARYEIVYYRSPLRPLHDGRPLTAAESQLHNYFLECTIRMNTSEATTDRFGSRLCAQKRRRRPLRRALSMAEFQTNDVWVLITPSA